MNSSSDYFFNRAQGVFVVILLKKGMRFQVLKWSNLKSAYELSPDYNSFTGIWLYRWYNKVQERGIEGG